MSTIATPAVQRAKQLTRGQLLANFDCDFAIDDKAQVKVAPEWQKAWLVAVALPVPTGITRNVLLHKRAAPVFQAWFRLWTPEVCRTIKTFDGSFVPRLMRLAKNLPVTDDPTKIWASYLSRHTRGIAADFNAAENRQGQVGAGLGQKGCLAEVIALARTVRVEVKDVFGKTWSAGIVCGADWSPLSVRDDQHFEVGCLP